MTTYAKGKAVKLSNNFTSTEFDCKCGKYCNKTIIDSKLVKYLQLIREHFGKPIVITSGYRCAIHNSSPSVNGAKNSKHCLGMAADIIVKGIEPKEVAKFAESIGVKGIGLYDTFTHIDTRESKSFWYGNNEEYRETFNNSSNSPVSPELTTANKITVSLPTLQIGNKNKFVGMLQALLGISADGIYGNATKAAVISYQKKKGISADGIVGKDTWERLLE